MKITFKEVGQGDSIIFEWLDNDIKKIGIIDCKLHGGVNPVLIHLINGKYTQIDFLIISHPHTDHYSGYEELLSYVKDKKITINRFGHTIKEIGKQYWEWFEVGNQDAEKLARIIKLANELYETNQIKRFEYPIANWQIELSGNIVLKSLSPSHDEIGLYQSAVKLNSRFHKKESSRAANYLSTIFKLKVCDRHILLTSDAESISFERINKFGDITGKVFCVCQIPHHGSINNYNELFWKNIDVVHNDMKAIVSSGDHKKYHHPDYDVIKKFHDAGYEIRATNMVYGMKEYIESILNKTLILDSGSELVEEYKSSGDREFNF